MWQGIIIAAHQRDTGDLLRLHHGEPERALLSSSILTLIGVWHSTRPFVQSNMLRRCNWFRLETLFRQDSNQTVQGKEVLGTRTDFVNKHPSLLQTPSYSFSRTSRTSEVCVGAVKGFLIHKNNPTQHFSDLLMLSEIEELQPVLLNLENGHSKDIDCVRVNGATDEGPSHHQVQYWWTEWQV